MTTKLTAPQKQVLMIATIHAGIVRSDQFSITVLRNLKKAGLLKDLKSFGEYAITEAGVAAVGKSEDWPLIHLMICEYKLKNHHLRDCGKVIIWGNDSVYRPEDRLDFNYYSGTLEQEIDRIAEHLALAIELTRAEIRAGLV